MKQMGLLEIYRPLDVEADLPMKDQAPESVKDKYLPNLKDKFVAWIDEDGTYIGCIKNNRSISVKAVDAFSLHLHEMEPARGEGFVELSINSEAGACLSVIASARYSQKSLVWLQAIQPVLAEFLNLQQTYEYLGKDA